MSPNRPQQVKQRGRTSSLHAYAQDAPTENSEPIPNEKGRDVRSFLPSPLPLPLLFFRSNEGDPNQYQDQKHHHQCHYRYQLVRMQDH
jgi:hypothetical protein